MAKKKTAKSKRVVAEQRKSKVGYKNPPEEAKWKPGESGNPKGPPVRRTNLWIWFCKYMELTDKQLAKLDRAKLTQAQQSALKLVENMKAGDEPGSERLARYVVDREEGKATEHLIIGNENTLTDAECDEIREVLRKNAD